MRVIHSSDWHLGHVLRGEISREHEHRAFLGWLVETCAAEAADVLLVTGDVFDSATPSASAERMWFETLAAARRARPAMDIVAIAGNHDSPARLGAPAQLLRELGVHVVGALPRTPAGAIDLDRVMIEVAGGRGLVAAVPFLRPADVPFDVEDPLEVVYGEVIAAARARRRPGQAVIAMGHLYVAGADVEYLSERRVSIGGQESAPLRLFPADLDYVALGHIHRAQQVGRTTIRYAGAPIALALPEARNRQQICVVDVEPGSAEIRSIAVPRVVEIVRVPKRGAAPLAEVVGALAELPALDRTAIETRPFLEVVVALAKPEPNLRALVEAALEGKHVRLVQLHVEQTGDRAALGDRIASTQRLAELDPRDVFTRLWSRDHADAPESAVVAAFQRLLEEVRGDREDPS